MSAALMPHAWVRVRALRQDVPTLWVRLRNHLEHGNYDPAERGVRFDGYVPEPAPSDPTRYPVLATEDRLPLHRLREALKAGRFRANDLIDAGRGWEALGDCVETSDLLEARHRRRRRVRWALATVAMVLASIAITVL